MKKTKTTIQTLAALLVAAVATTACSSDDDTAPGDFADGSRKVYTLTVEAAKGGDATTRALSLSDDGKTLYGKWEEGEKVWVLKQDNYDTWQIIGHLTPTNISTDGLSCTLTGSLDASLIRYADGLEVGDMLKLELGDDIQQLMFALQDGSLQTISDNFDHNIAMVTTGQVSTATVEGETVYNVTTTGTATFEPQVAIVRFNFQDKMGRPIEVSYMHPGLLPYNMDITPASSSVYVAVNPMANSDISLRVQGTVGGESVLGNGDPYLYSRSGVTFEKGKFYDITVKMNRHIYLNYLSSDFTAQDGDVLERALFDEDCMITISDGATVTLQDASINYENAFTSGTHAGITCLGDTTIILDGTSFVRSFGSGYPAIKPGGMGSTLTIKGSGKLQAYGADNAAAIGGSSNLSCGNILISGGTVEATGGTAAPAIGNYGINSCGTITIDNTVTRVTATKGSGATNSIGFAGTDFGSCGTVTIGGTIYWDGAAYQNDGETYLATSPLTYQP
ncbi:MAG: hypothetical protein K6B13_12035 [Prevotella sp.]|nr:hypothetical protein [Prevotella sp.]